MAQGKKSFTVYCDWKSTFDALPDEIAGKLIKHIFSYVNDENPETDDIIINAVFANIKNQLKRDLVKWEEKREKNRQNAFKRWDKKDTTKCDGMQSDANGMQNDAKNAVTVTVTDTVKVINNNIEVYKAEFKNSLQPFLETYGKDMLNSFYSYWTEKSPRGRKMRFQKEKVFDVKRRLLTWSKNDFNNKNKKAEKNEQLKQITTIAREQYPNL